MAKAPPLKVSKNSVAQCRRLDRGRPARNEREKVVNENLRACRRVAGWAPALPGNHQNIATSDEDAE
jgi:hypothetical protein